MTRGRDENLAHLVAENHDDARQQWIETFGRDRADLGPGHAARRAAEDLERYAPHRPLEPTLADLRAAWTNERDLQGAIARTERRYHAVAAYGEVVATRVAEPHAEIDELRDDLTTATNQVRASLHEPAIRSLPPGRIEQEHANWAQQRRYEEKAAQAAWKASNNPRPSRGRTPYGSPSRPDRGRGISR